MIKLHKLIDELRCLWYNIFHFSETEVIEMYSALDVARYVVNYANSHDMMVSNLKLQKILYFIQLNFLGNDPSRPCFSDEIEAWPYGPVIPNVYQEFKRYGSLSIPPVTEYYDTSNGIWNTKKVPYKTKMTSADQELVENVVKMCDEYSASDLVSISHRQSPWIKARNSFDPVISIASMLDFVRQNSEHDNG